MISNNCGLYAGGSLAVFTNTISSGDAQFTNVVEYKSGKDFFRWYQSGWSACVPCGGAGTQSQTTVQCQNVFNMAVADTSCTLPKPPAGPRACVSPACPPVCGDGICNGTETCSSCPGDCGTCAVNGQCGSASGASFAVPGPVANLCNPGIPSAVPPLPGTGPWTWTCAGIGGPPPGGPSPLCTALLIPINGVCGTADGVSVATAPTINLCSVNIGPAPTVAGTGPWTWTCSGNGSGTNASCSAPLTPINGVCGPANGTPTTVAPTLNLCSTGTATAVAGAGPWTWNCNGNGSVGPPPATNMACTATLMVIGACGVPIGVCTGGALAGPPVDNVVTRITSWTCNGSGGGGNASCTAPDVCPDGVCNGGETCATCVADCGACAPPPVSGACGTANGVAGPPVVANLCVATNIPTAVSGTGPWTWGCNSGNGGTNTAANACSAPVLVCLANGVKCGEWDGGGVGTCVTDLTQCATCCAGGSPNYDIEPPPGGGIGACPPGNLEYAYCGPPPSCGPANGVATAAAPSSGLCGGGTPSLVAGAGPWTWTCANGTSKASCSAPVASAVVNGACGATDGTANGTCIAGTACCPGLIGLMVQWICKGSGGGTDAICSAPVSPIINGACGTANGVAVSSAPTTNLCSAGTAATFAGTGPWNWSCNGSGGGANAACSAPLAAATVNGVCGSASGTPTSTAPIINLCSSGTPVSFAGTGPWTWGCNGSGGGTSTAANGCSAPIIAAGCMSDGTICMDCQAGVGCSIPYSCGSCCCGNPASVAGSTTTCTNGVIVRTFCGGPGGVGPPSCDTGGSPSPVSAACTVPLVNGACGTANGVVTSSAPTTNLCSTGALSPLVSGTGPWNWGCAGSGGGTNAACSAPLSGPVVDGTCGTANGAAGPPVVANLCVATNTATPVTDTSGVGIGPWTWGCNSSNGGTNTAANACSAPASGCGVPIADGGKCGEQWGPVISCVSTAYNDCSCCASGNGGSIGAKSPPDSCPEHTGDYFCKPAAVGGSWCCTSGSPAGPRCSAPQSDSKCVLETVLSDPFSCFSVAAPLACP